MNLGVLRGDTLFLAVAGPAHALVLGDEVQDLYDPQAGRGLGAGSAVILRYFQARIQPGEVLVFCPDPPAAWTPAALAGSPALTMEHLRRRLLNGIGPNLQAVVLKFQTGSGEVHALRHRSTASAGAPMAHPAAPAPSPSGPPDAPPTYLSEFTGTPAAPALTPAAPSRSSLPRPPAAPPLPAPIAPPPALASNRASPAAAPSPAAPPPPDRAVNQAAALEAARLARQRRLERKKQAAVLWQGWKSSTGRLGLAGQALIGRLTPQRATPGGAQPHRRTCRWRTPYPSPRPADGDGGGADGVPAKRAQRTARRLLPAGGRFPPAGR